MKIATIIRQHGLRSSASGQVMAAIDQSVEHVSGSHRAELQL